MPKKQSQKKRLGAKRPRTPFASLGGRGLALFLTFPHPPPKTLPVTLCHPKRKGKNLHRGKSGKAGVRHLRHIPPSPHPPSPGDAGRICIRSAHNLHKRQGGTGDPPPGPARRPQPGTSLVTDSPGIAGSGGPRPPLPLPRRRAGARASLELGGAKRRREPPREARGYFGREVSSSPRSSRSPGGRRRLSLTSRLPVAAMIPLFPDP